MIAHHSAQTLLCPIRSRPLLTVAMEDVSEELPGLKFICLAQCSMRHKGNPQGSHVPPIPRRRTGLSILGLERQLQLTRCPEHRSRIAMKPLDPLPRMWGTSPTWSMVQDGTSPCTRLPEHTLQLPIHGWSLRVASVQEKLLRSCALAVGVTIMNARTRDELTT